MIKAVIFDCFGVLTTDVWRAFFDSLHPSNDLDHLRYLNKQMDSGLLDRQEFLKEVYKVTGSQPVELESLRGDQVIKNTQVLGLVAKLKSRGIKTALLSNVSSNWIRESFLSKEDQLLFDEIVLSYEVHMTKSDPNVFKLVCERLGSELTETLMIDDLPSNCETAMTLGMKAIVYKDFHDCSTQLGKLELANTDT